jgi:predicted dehydrogenase
LTESPIRVGLIRCDTHGAYYGALMAAHDPLRLRTPLAAGATARYSWQAGGAHFYFYTDYGDPGHMTVDAVDGFRLTRVWDEHADAAECLAAVFDEPPLVCSSAEKVSDDVDLVFIADCNGDGSDHLQLARPGLEKGVATFVDKPLAFTTDEARSIVTLAADNDAALASASILQVLPGVTQFSRRLAEVGELQFGAIQGGGLTLAGQIHTICVALQVFGNGVLGVRAMGAAGPDTIHLDYGPAREQRPVRGVTLSCDVGAVWHCAFHVSAHGPAGAIHSPPLGDFVFPFGAAAILRQVRDVMNEGKVATFLAQMLEAVAIAEAARQSHATGKRVELPSATNSGHNT